MGSALNLSASCAMLGQVARGRGLLTSLAGVSLCTFVGMSPSLGLWRREQGQLAQAPWYSGRVVLKRPDSANWSSQASGAGGQIKT